MKLMTVEAARATMLGAVRPLPAEAAPLLSAMGRTLAEDVFASRDQPPFAASAMDGWAVRSIDSEGVRRIAGESAAGRGFDGVVAPREAVRIFTGAPMPDGADAIVIQEDARRDGENVWVPNTPAAAHLRPAGQDFRAGDRLLIAGDRLDAWRLALAAAAGHAEVRVARSPRVGILSTGDELVEPGSVAGPHQIFNSSTTALAALVSTWGGAPATARPVGDDLDATSAAAGSLGGDLLVTIGGASVGDHDLVKPALAALGLDMLVESVAMRPGKPTWFGCLADGRLVLGLPGNPASSLVAAELFLKPLLRVMQGASPEPAMTAAVADAALPPNGGREHWMRARSRIDEAGVLRVSPMEDQDSSLVSAFAQADCLIRRQPQSPAITPGQVVQVLRLDRLAR